MYLGQTFPRARHHRPLRKTHHLVLESSERRKVDRRGPQTGRGRAGSLGAGRGGEHRTGKRENEWNQWLLQGVAEVTLGTRRGRTFPRTGPRWERQDMTQGTPEGGGREEVGFEGRISFLFSFAH